MNKHLRTFYIMTITQVMSMIGSQMTQFALGIWVYTETGNTTPLMVALFFSTLPTVAGGSLAGVFADRWDRRKIIMATDAGQAIPTFLMMLSFFTGNFALWQLYLAAFIQGTFGMLQGSAVEASISMLVPEDYRDQANGLRQVTGPLAGLIAPVIGGLLYALVDVEGILLIDVITFLIAVGVISQMHIPMPRASAEGGAKDNSVWQDMKASLDFLRQRPILFWLMMYFTVTNFLAAGPLNLLSPYLLELTDSKSSVGLLMGLMNLGFVVGGLSIGFFSGKVARIHLMLGGILMMCFWIFFLGLARTPLTLGFTMFMLTIPNPVINGVFMSLMQIKTPADMQGRVFALMMQLSAFSVPFSFLVTGWLVDQVFEPAVNGSRWEMFASLWGSETGAGMGLLISLCGIIIAMISVVVYILPHFRHMEAELPDYIPEAEEVPLPAGVPAAA